MVSQRHHSFEPQAPLETSIEPNPIIDRILNSRPSHFDKTTLTEAGRWIHGYMTKFGPTPQPAPPDPHILAQLLAVSDWGNIQGLLHHLMAERQPAGEKYAWFVTVALQRIHGIRPDTLKARRADLREVKRPKSPKPPEPTQDNLEFAGDLIADLAKAKGMTSR